MEFNHANFGETHVQLSARAVRGVKKITFLKGERDEDWKNVNNFGSGVRVGFVPGRGEQGGANGYGVYIPGASL